MFMIERLEKIATIEGIDPSEFNLTRAREFLDEYGAMPERKFSLELEYRKEVLSELSLKVIYRDLNSKVNGIIPEVIDSCEVYCN